MLPYAERNGLVVLAYGALCRGLLTGKITAKTEFKGDDLRKVDPKFQQPRLGNYLAAVARLDAFARERYGKTVLALAVRWLLDRGKIVALWGARRPDQLAPVKDVMGWILDGSTCGRSTEPSPRRSRTRLAPNSWRHSPHGLPKQTQRIRKRAFLFR